LLKRLLRIAPPESAQPSAPPRPRTTPVLALRPVGTVLLPREQLVVPVPPEVAQAVPQPGADAPAPWFAVIEEAAFQAAEQNPASLPGVCTLAQLTRVVSVGQGAGLALRGMTRAQVYGVGKQGPHWQAEVVVSEPPAPDATRVEPLAAELRALGKQLLRKRPAGPFYLSAATVDAVREPDALADLLAAWCNPDLVARRGLLAAVDIEARMRLVIAVLQRQLGSS
jgi:ATP-dependent Lon protease